MIRVDEVHDPLFTVLLNYPLVSDLHCAAAFVAHKFVSLCVFSDLVAQRGEKLELLIDKTENLVDSVSLKTEPCPVLPRLY